MSIRYLARKWQLLLVAAAVWLLSAAGLIVQSSAAGELDKLDTSLKIIPGDAAFYSSMLRGREQVQAVANSHAWAKLKAMPFVQMGLAMYQMQAADTESVPGRIEATLKDPEVRKLLDLLGDMTSQEMFLYGDASMTDFVQLAQRIIGAVRYEPAVLQMTGKAEGLNPNQLQGRVMLGALASNSDLIKVPDLIVGFRLANSAAAKEHLDKLESLGTQMLSDRPELKDRLKRTKIGNYEYLVLSLDGKLVPWDELPIEQLQSIERTKGDVEKVVARLKQTTLVIALGLRDNYLLLSIGSSTSALARLGDGQRLIDRPELKPLEKFVDKRLASIAYLSQAMSSRLQSGKKDLDDLVQTVNQVLPAMANSESGVKLTEEQVARIRKDAAALAEDIKQFVPQAGAMMGFSLLTDQGVEGYRYDWSSHVNLDSSKPLGVLRHVGGNPLMALVCRVKVVPARYDLCVKWLKVAYGYFEDFAVPQIPANERAKVDKFKQSALPLVQQMDKANRELLIPALADGQVGLVLDAKLKSDHFVESLPSTDKPLPMIEPAIVLGVSDAPRLLKACHEYRTAINGLIDAVRQIEGAEVPAEVKVPEPKVTTTEVGTIYGYPLPEDWGVDKKIVPNLGLADKVAVVSLSRQHSQRLLSETPLTAGGVLTKADRPLGAAVVFDWSGLVDAVTPWIDLAIKQIPGGPGNGPNPQAAAIGQQVHTVLQVLKVFRTVTAESYLENGALVSHSLLEMQDVAE